MNFVHSVIYSLTVNYTVFVDNFPCDFLNSENRCLIFIIYIEHLSKARFF